MPHPSRSFIAVRWARQPQNPLESRWILSRLNAVSAEVHRALADYRFDEAASAIYQFFWGDLCDWYLEIVKLRLNFGEATDKTATSAALTTFVHVFEAALRLLSPFMPFLTEEIWHALYAGLPPAKSIALTRYPQAADFPVNQGVVRGMNRIRNLVATDARAPQGTWRSRKGTIAISIVDDATPAIGSANHGDQQCLHGKPRYDSAACPRLRHHEKRLSLPMSRIAPTHDWIPASARIAVLL